MDCIGYRISGELSDITVVIDKEEFHLHKFPLFVRSNYFKNLTSLQTEHPNTSSRVELDNFPGGPRTFEIIADYCYNKEVDINLNNVVSVKCAAEYLEMTGGTGRGGLAMLADNVLFDLTYSAKTKRDYYLPLLLLEKSAKYKIYAEKSGLVQKLIDSFLDNLFLYVKSASIYESINYYEKNQHKLASSNTSTPRRNLHTLSLGNEHLKILNNLPLNWMNDLIKSSARIGLNSSLLSFIIQNYIDYNTGLNTHYNIEHEKSTNNKSLNLLNITARIIQADKKFGELVNNDADDESEEEKPGLLNLVDITGQIREKDKPVNLINIASNVLKVASKVSNLDDEEADLNDNEQEEEKPSNLINIAGDILEKEEPSNLINIAAEILDNDPPKNLISIAGNILEKEEPSNLINIAAEILNNDPPKNLINIAGDILHDQSCKNLASITKDIIKTDAATEEIDKEGCQLFSKSDVLSENLNLDFKDLLNDEEKLNIISVLTQTLIEFRIEPQFPISWLLLYMNSLHNLNADSSIKSAFHRWTWSAVNDLKDDSKELSSVPPSVMVQLTQDVSSKDSNTSHKLVDLVDKYIEDLNNENKLNPDTFIELLSSIPRNRRSSFDNLTKILLDLFEKENHNINSDKQKELLDLIDFDKLNEKTLESCKNSEFICQKYVTEAALNLCKRLRKELDEAKLLVKSYDSSKSARSSARYSTDLSYTPSSYTSSSRYSTSTTNRARSRESKLNESRNVTSLLNNPSTNKLTYPTLATSLSSLSTSSNYHVPLTPRSTYTSSLLTANRLKSLNNNNNSNNNNNNKNNGYKTNRSTHSTHHHHRHHHHNYLDFDYDYDHFDYLDDDMSTLSSSYSKIY